MPSLVLFAATLLSGQSLPKAPGADVVSLTPKPGSFTEPAIAVNPQNPQQILAVYQDNVHAAYSQDSGRTWKAADGVEPANYKVSGDVSAAYDNQGHAFVCYIAFDKLGSFNYWGHNASRNGVFVRRSLDGGATWDAKHVPVAEQVTAPGIPFEDKPYIVTDASKSRYAGNLYVGWTRWRLADSQIVFSRSTDGGQTWSPAVEIDRHPGLPRDDNGAAEGFMGTVGPDGRLYATWSQDNEIMLTTSSDGGKTFSRARPIIHTAPIMFAIQTLERANGFPQIAIDPQSQRLYVTWSDYSNGDIDIFSSTSTDGGKKWSAPLRVNSDPVHNGAEQFFQWLAVDPVDGSANVVFYDRRDDPDNRKQTVTLARSIDSGKSYKNFAWTSELFEAEGVFFGDYSGIAAYGGRVYGIWTEKPVPVPVAEGKTGEKPEAVKSTEIEKVSTTAKQPATREKEKEEPTARGTVVKVGVAAFKDSTAGPSK